MAMAKRAWIASWGTPCRTALGGWAISLSDIAPALIDCARCLGGHFLDSLDCICAFLLCETGDAGAFAAYLTAVARAFRRSVHAAHGGIHARGRVGGSRQ